MKAQTAPGGLRIAALPAFPPIEPLLLDAGSSNALSSSEENAGESPTIGLLRIPRHLGKAWEHCFRAISSSSNEEAAIAFQGFAKKIAAFLQFKRVRFRESARFDVIQQNEDGPLRLTGDDAGGENWLLVNLGEENASLVFSSDGDLVARLALRPGEGCLIPEGISCDAEGTGDGPSYFLLVS